MIYSMYQNAGIISLIYPVMVFGYAMLEEIRPKKEFWTVVRFYTIFVVMFKFFFNMSCFDEALGSEGFEYWSSFVKIGLYDYDEMWKLVKYMMPEILILCFIMLNEIKLKLIGLYYVRECDIETITEGIQRNIEKGDEEKMNQIKIESANMCLNRYFESKTLQHERRKEFNELKMRDKFDENCKLSKEKLE